MTVAELIERLRAYPPELRVVVDQPSQMDGGSYLMDPELEDGVATSYEPPGARPGDRILIIR